MTNVGYASLALTTGLGIPVMATLNAGLAARIGSTTAASLVLFLVGAAVAASVLILTHSTGGTETLRLPPLSVVYLGGVLVAFYVLSITWLVPRFGVGNAVFFVLLGQIIATALIDQFGLLSAPYRPVDGRRLLGIGFMLVGVFLSSRAAVQ